MPELPEVQTTVNGINRSLRGLKIVDVWTDYPVRSYDHLQWSTSNGAGTRQIKNRHFFDYFKKQVVGKKIVGATRRAKNVLIHLSNGKTVLVHMKMTGHLLFGKYRKVKLKVKSGKLKDRWIAREAGPLRDDSYNQFIHLVFTLSNDKHLALSDVRKFAKVTVLPTQDSEKELGKLGPEPLEKNFTARVLAERLKKKPNGKIKQVLMDQSIISGIGNIYSDEILWAAGVHPLRKIKTLSKKEVELIWKNIKTILKKGIDFRGDSLSDYRNLNGRRGGFQYHHRAYQQTGKPCSWPGCKGTIQRIVLGGRSAHFCPAHQK